LIEFENEIENFRAIEIFSFEELIETALRPEKAPRAAAPPADHLYRP